ncbi:hypothetical protein [Streptomyces minutiscleroticus]|uniref:hypothetical protein n=1 Tax=Streptomyces minutiscleroticus TaxID=68238 RepID=UPI001E36C7D8|nr:hypothetical protein [Streptomyces minutiscleroticus]
MLRRSQDFRDGRGPEVVEAAERQLEADLTALAGVLTGRWGAPVTVDLWPYLEADRPDRESGVPEPPAFLCTVAGGMQVWRPPSSGRPALAIGQADREFPLEPLLAVGDASSLPE